MRARALHGDVLVVTSALLQVNCVLVRAPGGAGNGEGETFLIDSPVLPEELESLPALLEQAHFPTPSALLATHGDWDHLLGRLAFPGLALGCAESTAARLTAHPGEAQRELRAFDEQLYIERPRPLALGSLQSLPVPGRCEIGEREIELHPTGGHTADGMALVLEWAGVLVAGDYLSAIELPVLHRPDELDAYLETLALLRGLLARVEHVVSGHGPTSERDRALELLEQDAAYVEAVRDGVPAGLPGGRNDAGQRRLHARNLAALEQESQ
jgi:glyoxylase-like metal-dependent hydrolase (beta-lactamase superfamily II)